MIPSKKTFTTILLILIALFGFYKLGEAIAPGFYPYAEVYELNSNEQDVIEAIAKFKSQHPEYIVPDVTVENKPAGNLDENERRKEGSNVFLFYFYYPNEKQIIFTWIRNNGKDKTDFAFVSINEGLDLGNWREINQDFNFFENKNIKKLFEVRILDGIRRILEKDKLHK